MLLGVNTLQDVTPTKLLDEDVEVKHNGHRKVKGYRLDTMTDLDTEVPLPKEVTGSKHQDVSDEKPPSFERSFLESYR